MRACIARELERKREHAALAVEAEPCLGDDVARGVVGQERLVAVAGPFHRPAEALGRPDHRDLLGIDIEARAEGAADIGADHAHALRRHVEAARERRPQAMDALATRDQGVLLRRLVVAAERRARLHEGADGALAAHGLLHHEMRARQRRLHRGAVAERIVEREIARGIRPQHRRTRRERFLDVGHGRQGVVFDRDRLGGVARGRERLRHDDGNRLAYIAHGVGRERQLQLVEDLVLGRRRERRQLDIIRVVGIGMVRHADVAVDGIVGAGEHREHAGMAARG